MNWLRFWSRTFMLHRPVYQPHARAIGFIILPSIFKDSHPNLIPDNDNG